MTEADIASYLAITPAFFERHAELLGAVQLASPHGARAVSLQERQIEMLRDKLKGMEQRVMEMIRHGQDNVALADKLHRFTRSLLLATSLASLPEVLLASLKREFMVPQAALRLWGADEDFAALPVAQGASDDTRALAQSLNLPYCGLNTGFEAVQWLDQAETIASVALIPLRCERPAPAERVVGLLVLGSPDATRYSVDMATDLLARIGEIASAGLVRLLPLA